MAIVKPFRAVRPARDKAHLVVSKAVVSYPKRILNVILEANPFTFLHVMLPEHGKKEKKTRPNSIARFIKTKEKYKTWLELEYLEQDEKKCFYIYQQIKNKKTFTGIIAATAVTDYYNNVIKKHENTITSREHMFKDYLKTCDFNAEPVLLTYPDNNNINLVMDKYLAERPEYDFTTNDTIRHKLWIIDNDYDIQSLEYNFQQIDALYIADGHHRSASSALLAQETNDLKSENNPSNYFMSYIISDSQLDILDYNRLIKDINGLSLETFIKNIKSNFIVTKKGTEYRSEGEHRIGMYMDGIWYELIPKPETFDKNHPVSNLDTEILFQNLLKPILNIEDLKTTKRVDFIGGHLGLNHLKELVDKEKGKVAFALPPVSTQQLIEIADKNYIMPPKSTWIEPKMRCGLTIYKL